MDMAIKMNEVLLTQKTTWANESQKHYAKRKQSGAVEYKVPGSIYKSLNKPNESIVTEIRTAVSHWGWRG